MSKDQIIETLLDQINNNMNIFLAILAIALTAFFVLQWRLSDKQIEKLKVKIKQELISEYRLDRFGDLAQKVSAIEKDLQEFKKAMQLHDEDVVSELNDTVINIYDHDPAKAAICTNKAIRLMTELFSSNFVDDSVKAVAALNIWGSTSKTSGNTNAERITEYIEKQADEYLKLGKKLFNSPDLTNKN